MRPIGNALTPALVTVLPTSHTHSAPPPIAPFPFEEASVEVRDSAGLLVELRGDGSGWVRGRTQTESGPFKLDPETTLNALGRFIELGIHGYDGEYTPQRLQLGAQGSARVDAAPLDRVHQRTVSYCFGTASGAVSYDPREPGSAQPIDYAVEELLTRLLPEWH